MASICFHRSTINTAALFSSPTCSSLSSLFIRKRSSKRTLPPVGSRSSRRIRWSFPVIAFKKNPIPGVQKEMTIKPAVRISERRLVVKGKTILEGVPDVVTTTPASCTEGLFLGAVLEDESSSHVVPLGTLRDVRFMSCFRFKLWWMAHTMGERGRDIHPETQFLLVESTDGSYFASDGTDVNAIVYTVFLPLIESSFRACLQGREDDSLELFLESGDADVKASSFSHAVLVQSGTDPFATVTEAVATARAHLNSFRPRREKRLPAVVDLFGWCTWDAFYQDVTQEGVEAGIANLAAGGTPAKFVIIDDGWQSVAGDETSKQESPLMRLTGIKENSKFQDKDDPGTGIQRVVMAAKEKHGVKFVYVWHAITGYWGGVSPGTEYNSTMKYPNLSNGVMENEPTWKTDALAVQGLGLVNPKDVFKFYNELHGYLASSGVDGVKVDVQSILETLGNGHGGRVELTKQYHQALDASIARNFTDNGCIACMSHSSDALFCSKQTAVVRASDDFYPRDPMSHTIHIASVAYNSVLLGEFMQPDWDMFHSLHPAAEYHASARAISGGPVYVSDAPGNHDFALLKKLVLPDGSILRARLPARPTIDSLFCDPARDGVSLLKIWNMNKHTGVIGIYNCQGAAWNKSAKKNTFHETTNSAITGSIRGRDVHLISEATQDSNWSGDCAFYCHSSGEVTILPHNASLPLSLKVLEHRVYTVTPIKVLPSGCSFAPFGLIDMYNSGGAIETLMHDEAVEISIKVRMEVKGCGKFGAFSSVKPNGCTVGGHSVDFEYEPQSGLLICNLSDLPKESHTVEVHWQPNV